MDLLRKFAIGLAAIAAVQAFALETGKARIHVRADKVTNEVSRLTTGACMEDVNHEIYGGIDSQMIFGESFEEPAPAATIAGFIYEGTEHNITSQSPSWHVEEGILTGPAAEGAKLLALDSVVEEGQIDVELFFEDKSSGVAGLIVSVSESAAGADNFNGYEISLDPAGNQIIFGKHRQNWQPIGNIDCLIKAGEWNKLSVVLSKGKLRASVNGVQYIDFTDPAPLPAGLIGLRTWGREAKYRNLRSTERAYEFEYAGGSQAEQVSKMWSAVYKGSAGGGFAIERNNTYNGRQSQRITMTGGNGSAGIANSGLNRRGMAFVAGKEYEGLLRVCADKNAELLLTLENADGSKVHAKKRLPVAGKAGAWQRVEFTLTPNAGDTHGRFVISLDKPASVSLGYALLQPGEWGRFKGLQTRKDVAEALVEQNLTVLRYGGCMANAEEYRWKKMVGPRDERPPYKGWWYPYSSNGWGIIDFIKLCEAAGVECVPDFNIEETPEDMSDFIEYIRGPLDSEWGAKRAADGHRSPFDIKYIQIGNEETVDAHYLERFKLLAAAIWEKAPDIIPVVGDFAYNEHISDPYNFGGAPRISSLEAQREILRFAAARGKTVWFDVHIWNNDPRDPDRLDKGLGLRSFVTRLEELAGEANFKVCVFEENATNHRMRRALSHAHAINEIQRYEHEVPILCAANCLQPDGHNDNGWDQGLLFLNQSKAWGQPSYYVTQMYSSHYQPLCVESYVESYNDSLDVTACRSEDGKLLSIRVVNLDEWPVSAEISFDGFKAETASITQLQGELDARNTAENPE
ncbi:MAG: family 16 glycoside hydrolase, partial [Phycisphaerae bacterium]